MECEGMEWKNEYARGEFVCITSFLGFTGGLESIVCTMAVPNFCVGIDGRGEVCVIVTIYPSIV